MTNKYSILFLTVITFCCLWKLEIDKDQFNLHRASLQQQSNQ